VSAILVVRPSSLGDVVHALSLVDDVRNARPDIAIDWVAEEAFAELPRLCPYVRRVVPLALRRWRNVPWRAPTWRELGAFRRTLAAQRYEAILDLQEQLKGAIVSRLARGTRHGFDRASAREPLATLLDDVHHRVPRELHFAMRCRMLGAAALGYRIEGPPRWSFAATPPASAMPASRYAVALHATSRSSKLWPDERWRLMLGRLSQAGLATLLPWGNEEERMRGERLASGIANAAVPPRQSLTELAALLQRAEVVVGVDTGLTHLAAALGTPTVALFTETDPRGAGVAIAGAHAKDVGGNGHVPSLAEVDAAVADVMRTIPRC
jgi:heptosyltransferase-1